MEEIIDFFNKPKKVVKLRGGLTNGMCLTREDPITNMSKKTEHSTAEIQGGTEYVQEVKQRETELYLKMDAQQYESKSTSALGLESLERLTSIGESVSNMNELPDETMNEVYSKYSFKVKEDTQRLPIDEYKQSILDSVSGFPVVIVEGPTGCGKTTQVPQWILDDSYLRHRPCNVVVTQPRRIAAISIAKRVAHERGWNVGGLVGYQVGLENRTSSDTRIAYVTTGVLLQKLVGAKTLSAYTHIILDEVHERDQEMDFLLLLVKRLQNTVSKNVKVILMSATINSSRFFQYYTIRVKFGFQEPAKVLVPKKNPLYNVKTYYLDDLTKFFGTLVDKAIPKGYEPIIQTEMHHLVIKLLNAFEKIDKQEDSNTSRNEADLPSVLIFLPGIYEIEELYMHLNDKKLREQLCDAECATYYWWVLPLHSTITADEQARVFIRAPPGHRKIILATNVAESSITVPDIKYVVDYCLMKTLVADDKTNFTSLKMTWASKANCEQREGRAGRVRDGRVYRLTTSSFYETFAEQAPPEIIRSPLERLVLLAKRLEIGPPSDILALAMDPPDLSNITRTLLVLKEIGAIKKFLNGRWCMSDGDITYMGVVMAKLPLDVMVSRLILIGYTFGCLEESIIMAAAMTVRNVFSSPFRERLNAYNSKLTWADGSTSDCIALLNVYKVWIHLRYQNYFKQEGNSEALWARRSYVQIRALREMDDMVKEIKHRLSREGIEVVKGRSPWAKHEIPTALKFILAGAFYPQYFVQHSLNEEQERDALKTLGGFDPRNTVYLKDFPDEQPSQIYTGTIKKIIKQQIGDEPRVIFDQNSRKIFLNFNDGFSSDSDRKNSGDPTIPGQVVLPVYKCVKARQLQIDIRLPILPFEKAKELAEALEMSQLDLNLENMVPRLPEIDDTHFPLKICLLSSVGKFWAWYDDESTMFELRQINAALNSKPLLAYTKQIAPGDMIAAPHNDGMQRARILHTLPRDMVEIQYVDLGAVGRVNVCNLRELPISCKGPPLAMRCRLAGVAPAPLLDPHGHWSRGAMQVFKELTRGKLLARVYSVVHGEVALDLLANRGHVNVNLELIKQGYAVTKEESYESKMNHDLRQSANDLNLAQKRAYNKVQMEAAFDKIREPEAPPANQCIRDQLLKGPYSPLETNIQALLYSSRGKQVHVEWNSVNSVILDTDPQQHYERLMVAAHVGQNESSSKLNLRHTTLMPNFPALPAIVTLLFTPSAEFRRNALGTQYASVLCGLGGEERGKPYFPEHDILVDIDAEIDNEDIKLINHIRYLMDHMLYCPDGQDMPTQDDETKPKIPAIIREDLLNLLRKKRKVQESEAVVNAWEWGTVPTDELLEVDPEMMQHSVMFPLHAPLQLYEPNREHLLALKRENDQLKVIVMKTPISSPLEISCKLCNTQPMHPLAMRIHLYSNAHIEKEEQLEELVF